MKKIIKMTALLSVLCLVACAGPFESKTCGIKNSQWERMSTIEQLDFEKSFREKQRLADQLKLNKIATKQQKNLAKQRRNNEQAQARRLNEEREVIKKQQSKINTDLDLKEQVYTNPTMTPENGLLVEVPTVPLKQ